MPNISEINGYLINADTASYAVTASFLSGSVTSASYAATASYSTTLGANLKNTGFTLALQASDGTQLSSLSSLNITSVTASIFSGSSFTGSLFGTASWANNIVSSSYAATASYSTTLGAVLSNQSDGTLRLVNSANTTISSVLVTASLANTASYVLNAISSSFAATASLAPNYVLNSATSSFVQNSQTSSFVTNSQTSSFVLNSQTSSFVTNAQTSSFVQNNQTGSFATTGSNTFIGNQTITGSLTASSGSVGGSNTMITVQRSNGTKTFEAGQLAGNSVINIFDSVGNTMSRIISNGSTYFASGSLNSVTVGSTGGSGKFNVRGDDASTTPNSTFINGNSVALMTILNNGNIGIGNSPAFNLDVSGSAIFRSQIIGPLTVSGTLIITGSISASAFNFVSSSLTQSRVLLDNTFDNTAVSAATPNSIRDRSPLLRVYGTYTTASTLTNYTNQIISAYLYPTFNPTNNTAAVFNTLVLEPQFLNINATGSARGLYVTPAFAGTHPNWRSIEWDNTEGYGLYGSGTARNYLNGSLGIGTLAPSASFHTTGSGIIVGSLALGTSSLGSTENTLVVGLPPAGGAGEGGQILLQASGGLYTTASMIDNYQNKFRVLRGTNAGSDAFKLQLDMHTGQMQLPNYNSATALTGSEVAMLGVDNNGNILTTTIAGAILTNNYVGTGFTNPIVTYMPFGATTVSGTEAQRQVASPVAGVIKNFYLRTNNTAPATSFTTWTVRVNGVNTGITLVISGGQAAGLYSNTTNSASITLGAEISLQVSTSVANSPQVNQYSFGIYPS